MEKGPLEYEYEIMSLSIVIYGSVIAPGQAQRACPHLRRPPRRYPLYLQCSAPRRYFAAKTFLKIDKRHKKLKSL